MFAPSVSALKSKPVTQVLDGLYRASEETDPVIISRAHEEISRRGASCDAGVAGLLAAAFMPVSRETGNFLYIIACAQRSRTIVEFGASFGISTIFLAAAVRDNGGGRVISSELNPAKVKKARQNLHEAGLGDLVEIREGDALKTLGQLEGEVDLLLLDGWERRIPARAAARGTQTSQRFPGHRRRSGHLSGCAQALSRLCTFCGKRLHHGGSAHR